MESEERTELHQSGEVSVLLGHQIRDQPAFRRDRSNNYVVARVRSTSPDTRSTDSFASFTRSHPPSFQPTPIPFHSLEISVPTDLALLTVRPSLWEPYEDKRWY